MEAIIRTEKSSLGVGTLGELYPELDREKLLQELVKLKLTVRPSLGIHYNQEWFSPRNVGFFSDVTKKYPYSASSIKSQPIPTQMKKLLAWVNSYFKSEFNGILVNYYQDGTNYIAKHSDNEVELSSTCGVVAISFGATRKFRIRNKKRMKITVNGKETMFDKVDSIVHNINMRDGDIIQMSGEFQQEFLHEIPKELKVKEPRISLTFRCHS